MHQVRNKSIHSFSSIHLISIIHNSSVIRGEIHNDFCLKSKQSTFPDSVYNIIDLH